MATFLFILLLCFSVNSLPTSKHSSNCSLPGIQCGRDTSTFEKNKISPTCFWSDNVEKELRNRKSRFLENFPTELRFVRVRSGCGKMKNRLLVTDGGDWYCARYRDNLEQLQGEVYSCALSRLLGLDNVPYAHVVEVSPSMTMWKAVWSDLESAGWRPLVVVILTRWIENLQPTNVPNFVLNRNNRLSQLPCTAQLNSLGINEAVYMMQWTDMVVLDYVTANVDRMIGHYFNQQWDRYSLLHPVNNLMKTKKDNESGFGHSFRLVSHYQHLHNISLSTACLLRRETFEKLNYLNKITIEDLDQLLYNSLSHLHLLPRLTQKHLFQLSSRIVEVLNHLSSICSVS